MALALSEQLQSRKRDAIQRRRFYCNTEHSDTPTPQLPELEQEHEHEGPCEQLLPWPEYRRLSKTPDSNHQINCKIRDCKWHQCD